MKKKSIFKWVFAAIVAAIVAGLGWAIKKRWK